MEVTDNAGNLPLHHLNQRPVAVRDYAISSEEQRQAASRLSQNRTKLVLTVACRLPMEMVMTTKSKDKKHDQAVEMTFPASDATAHGPGTGTELPRRPVDTEAPIITRKQIEHQE